MIFHQFIFLYLGLAKVRIKKQSYVSLELFSLFSFPFFLYTCHFIFLLFTFYFLLLPFYLSFLLLPFYFLLIS